MIYLQNFIFSSDFFKVNGKLVEINMCKNLILYLKLSKIDLLKKRCKSSLCLFIKNFIGFFNHSYIVVAYINIELL